MTESPTNAPQMASLKGHLLIAMPSLNDPFFARSVTYLCEHNEDGAMGLMLNNPVKLTLAELLNQIESVKRDSYDQPALTQSVLSGGPVDPERGFVLHTTQTGWSASQPLDEHLMITTSKDVLEVLGTEDEPTKYKVALGYAGWTAGQLEQELVENSWLTIPADESLIFDTPTEDLWEEATRRLGIDVWQISPDAGHA